MSGQKLGSVRRPALDRFAEKIALTDSGCIEWIGALNSVGYGQFWLGRTTLDETGKTYAHRWSYEYHVGPIPDGLHIDHVCRNRACVNPEHLEPVSRRENILRGVSPAALAARTDACPQGHPYAGDNLYVPPGTNHRCCRACRRVRSREASRRRHSRRAA